MVFQPKPISILHALMIAFKMNFKFIKIILVSLIFLLFVTSTHAQSPVCSRINEQLVELDRETGDPNRAAQISRQAEAQISEANRIQSHMRRMGCDEQSTLMGTDQLGECGALSQQVQNYRQNAVQLRSQSAYGLSASVEERRHALLSSYSNYGCDRQRTKRNDEDYSGSSVTIMPAQPDTNDVPGYERAEPELAPLEPAKPRGFGAAQPVCVRLCDGYFFPLSGVSTRSDAQDMCQAQCPSAKTKVFYRANGAEIGEASDVDGQTYSALPNALKYRTRTDQSCLCRKTGESWGATLKPAEEKVVGGTGDMVVTDKTADEIAKGENKGKLGSNKTPRKVDGLGNTPFRVGR